MRLVTWELWRVTLYVQLATFFLRDMFHENIVSCNSTLRNKQEKKKHCGVACLLFRSKIRHISVYLYKCNERPITILINFYKK